MRIELLDRLVQLVRLVGLALVAVALVSCGGEGEDARTLTADGWRLFEASEFEEAIEKFDEATEEDPRFSDAYTGRGWSWLGLDSLEVAVLEFDLALAREIRDPDPFAGQAIAYRDLPVLSHFTLAIVSADSALARDLRYVFSHDRTFDWRDLRLIMAQSHFAMSQYPQAMAQVDSLNPANALDAGSVSFVEDLLEEIQRLGREIAGS